jgi:SAM-dependent methyltransferase
MYLTGPQSSHFDAARFHGRSPRENHFDWDLYYRFKDQRERYWRERAEDDPEFRGQVVDHFTSFQRSVDTTIELLAAIERPRVLDIGLSSEQLDRAILKRTRGDISVLDVQQDAAHAFERAFGGRGAFVLGDVISFSLDPANVGRFDLVYSIGLVEHFPDKSDVVGAHVRLARKGGIVLVYVPIDSEINRTLTARVPEWENFGHRELLRPEELRQVFSGHDIDIVHEEAVGLLAAVWARKRG